MKLVKLNPVTSGTRHQINIQKNLLSKTNKLMKNSIFGLKHQSGRSSSNGRITVWHKGGGCKSNFREINFSNTFLNGIVVCIMHDPIRNAFISLNFNLDTFLFYRTLATNSVYTGSLVSCNSQKNELCLGNRTTIQNIPTGSIIHSLSPFNVKQKTVFARSAGTFCQIIQKSIENCKIRLPSGSVINTSIKSFATLGVVSNLQHNLTYTGKAGRSRLNGIRPTVRGIAMNPVDHPHGGRTNGGRPSVTPWGIPTKGKPTVLKKNKKNYD